MPVFEDPMDYLILVLNVHQDLGIKRTTSRVVK